MRHLQFGILFVSLVIFVGIATGSDLKKAPKPESEQIQKILQTVDFGKYIKSDTKVEINFMINERSEIMVTSTNNENLDNLFKHVLNYHKIALGRLEYNKIYTLPVSIKIK